MGLGKRGIPPPSNVGPGLLHPGPQAPGVEFRHRTGLTVVGPYIQADCPEATNIQERGCSNI